MSVLDRCRETWHAWVRAWRVRLGLETEDEHRTDRLLRRDVESAVRQHKAAVARIEAQMEVRGSRLKES